jgi:hypothetical protein
MTVSTDSSQVPKEELYRFNFENQKDPLSKLGFRVGSREYIRPPCYDAGRKELPLHPATDFMVELRESGRYGFGYIPCPATRNHEIRWPLPESDMPYLNNEIPYD